MWHSDDELFHQAKQKLYTAVVGDVMDRMGRHHQFLPPDIQPLREDMVVIGRAMTVLETDLLPKHRRDGTKAAVRKPFGCMMEALDDLRKNEVYLCSGASPNYALWGQNMATRAMKLGAAGAVVDGYSRDTKGILELGAPVFSYGGYAQDQAPRGEVVDYRVALDVGQVTVHSGDIVFGDIDGVCVVPQEVEKEVFERAFERAEGEKKVNEALREGMSAVEAFERFSIL